MSNVNEMGLHGLRLGPRMYMVRFPSPGGGMSRVPMDGYSPEDALRRMRKAGIRVPAALVHEVKLLGDRRQLEQGRNGDAERAQRIYDAARNVDWNDPADVARFEDDVKRFQNK